MFRRHSLCFSVGPTLAFTGLGAPQAGQLAKFAPILTCGNRDWVIPNERYGRTFYAGFSAKW